MTLIHLAVFTTLAYLLCIYINYGIGQCMTERPIIVGTIVGLFLGDVKTGVLIGAALEVVFMGIVNIGGVAATDAATSTAVATAFAIYSGLSVDEAVAIAVPVGLVSNSLFSLVIQLANLGGPFLDKICAKGDEKGLYIYQFVMLLLVFGVKGIAVFVGVYAGAEPVTAMLSSIPAVISTGLSVASGLLGAVGMAMLMRMLWTKELSIYYILGFVFVEYLSIPTMGIAVIGAVIAIAVGLREMQMIKLEKEVKHEISGSTVEIGKKEEEDFLA